MIIIKNISAYRANRWILLLVLLLVASFALPVQLSAQEVVPICYKRWEPVSYRDDKGQHRGSAVDLLHAAANAAGFRYELHELPYLRCLKMVHHGRMAAILADHQDHGNLESSALLTAHWNISALVSIDHFDSVKAVVTQSDLPVILSDKHHYPGTVEQMFKGNILRRSLNAYTMNASLGSGKFAAILEDAAWLQTLVDKGEVKRAVVLDPAIYRQAQYMNFGPGWGHIKDSINTAVSDNPKLVAY